MILKDSLVSSEKILLMFKNQKNSEISCNSQLILLQDLDHLDLIKISGNLSGIDMRFRDDTIQKLVFMSDLEAKEWYQHLNQVCFGLSLDKESGATEGKDRGATEEKDSGATDEKESGATEEKKAENINKDAMQNDLGKTIRLCIWLICC